MSKVIFLIIVNSRVNDTATIDMFGLRTRPYRGDNDQRAVKSYLANHPHKDSGLARQVTTVGHLRAFPELKA